MYYNLVHLLVLLHRLPTVFGRCSQRCVTSILGVLSPVIPSYVTLTIHTYECLVSISHSLRRPLGGLDVAPCDDQPGVSRHLIIPMRALVSLPSSGFAYLSSVSEGCKQGWLSRFERFHAVALSRTTVPV